MTRTLAPPADRPQPSLQDIYEQDMIAPPAHMREESRIDMGNEDIPVERYYSKEWHDLEVEKVWRKTWQVACRLEEIPNIGDHIVYEIVHDSLIVVRESKDSIRAYVNSCLHRGTQLRKSGGCVQKLQCPFHGWTWGLDGKLRKIPGDWDFRHVDKAKFNLPEAKVGLWGGFVFVNFDENCESLESYLEILPDHFREFQLEDRYMGMHVAKVMPCNWKLVFEAFAEAYHVPVAHSQTVPYYGDSNTQYDTYEDVRHVNRMISAMGVPSPSRLNMDPEKSREAVERDIPFYATGNPLAKDETLRDRIARTARKRISSSTRKDTSNLSDAVAVDLIQYTLFPNFVPYGGVGLSVGYRFRPLGDNPEKSIMEFFYYFPKNPDGSHPEPAKMTWLEEGEDWAKATEMGSTAMIVDQDTDNLRRIQRGLRATRKKGVTLANYQESRIRHFHQTLDAYINRD